MKEFDVLVLGGGPGGYVAAIRASQLGLRVALVESDNLGGVCLNWGCIPTKALIKSASVFRLINNSSEFGISVSNVKMDINSAVKRSRNIAMKLSQGVNFLLKKNRVEIFTGFGSFLDSNTIVVEGKAAPEKISSKNIIVATGARARILDELEPDNKFIWTYKEALVAKCIPKKILIVGAGVIGIEFAYFFNAIGSEVTVVDLEKRILSQLDPEVSDFAYKELKKQGVKFIFNSKIKIIHKDINDVEIKISGGNKSKNIKFNRILTAVGVVANIERLNLEKCHISIEEGNIAVDKFCRSSVKNIYAIGDVVRGPWLAHKASHEGMMVAEKIAGRNPCALEISKIPSCVYSDPQIASIGLTEIEAKNRYGEILVGKFPFSANGKALTEGESEGLVKTIFVKNTGELVGAHLVGSEVTELIHGFTIAMGLESTEEELINTVFPHPTLSETMLESVLNAFGREIHI